MWELIAANQRRSAVLLVVLAACLLGAGAAAGVFAMPEDPSTGLRFGLVGAGILWAVLSLVAFSRGDAILLAATGAKEITRDVHPVLFNVVEEMKIAANLPGMPRIFILEDPALNAFATGIQTKKSAVAVTAGLLARLNRDELQGVIAHEISHVTNRDVLYMTRAAVLLGGIQLLSEMIWRSSRYPSGRRYRSSSRSSSGGNGAAIFMIIALVIAIIGPILAQLLYLAISRRREYLADACGARLTRYPEGLASALEKIAGSDKAVGASTVVNALYIHNVARFVSTHPPIEQRIQILRAMGGAGFASYQKAFEAATRSRRLLPRSALKESEPGIRAADPGGGAPAGLEAERAAGDIIRAANHFTFLTCACGLKIKVPPEYAEDSVRCPRCGTENSVIKGGRS